MSNLRITDEEIADMEHRPSIQAIRIGRTEPYYLTYARLYQGNESLNPHLPGNRLTAAGQKIFKGEEHDKCGGNKAQQSEAVKV